MQTPEDLLKNNVEWAEQIQAEDPNFFSQLAKQQKPEYLWIGCSDSRVPANTLAGLDPGEVFVHRNIANCVIHTDLNCLSVIFYAVKVLKVQHIIVAGHYGCGGVQAGMRTTRIGVIDHWLLNIRDLYNKKRDELEQIDSEEARIDKMCELNVIQQVANVSHIPEIQEAWSSGQNLTIHGWIYDLKDGLLTSLMEPICDLDQVQESYQFR